LKPTEGTSSQAERSSGWGILLDRRGGRPVERFDRKLVVSRNQDRTAVGGVDAENLLGRIGFPGRDRIDPGTGPVGLAFLTWPAGKGM
jgi:hypothetical protein